MNILVADDEKEAVELIKYWLSKRGYDADVAFNGKEALDLIKADNYEMVIVDHNMPEITGLELIKFVKEYNPGTKTVMLTGYPHIAEFAAKELGADEYLTKPIKLEDIISIIDKYKTEERKDG